MTTLAKHVIILVIIRSLATPYEGPHKLYKRFLKLLHLALSIDDRIGKTLYSKSFDIVEGIC
jgi:hypothetical protein